MENPLQNTVHMTDETKVMLGNQMQIQLALLGGESIEEFVDRHAGMFRETVTKNPNIFLEYQQKPEETLAELKKILYH